MSSISAGKNEPAEQAGAGLSAQRWEQLGWAALALMACGLGFAAWHTLDWPMILDTPLMHYIAWRIREGQAPYRDIFDMNLPFTYALHLGVMTLLGEGDAAWRAFDLAWLGFTGVGIFLFCRPGGALGAAFAALLFAGIHLHMGGTNQGQRDFVMCGFIVWALWGVQRRGPRGGLLAGMMLAAGAWMKPVMGVLALLLLADVLRRRLFGLARSMVAGGLLVSAVMLGWLVQLGALEAFLTLMREYVLSVYPTLDPTQNADEKSLGHALVTYVKDTVPMAALALAVLLPGKSPRFTLALLALAYGVVHFVAQGKGWEYHAYPLYLSACLCAGLCVGENIRSGKPNHPMAAALLVAASCAAYSPLFLLKDMCGLHPFFVPTLDAMRYDVQQLKLPKGAFVQVMDTTHGGINVLYREKLVLPTRFLYDFPLYNRTDSAVVKGFQAEFMEGLKKARPAAILISDQSWPDFTQHYGKLKALPAFTQWLDKDYTLMADKPRYRLYKRKAARQ